MPLSPGQVLNNRYRIVKLLGQGGFGAIYRAWDISLEQSYAIKENLDTSADAQKQFKREAQILSSLSHPNLPRVIDHFTTPGQGQYLVMDYVEGNDLQELLDRTGGPLPTPQVFQWAEQVCDAMEYLHSQTPPIIHRDIKPANIKITPTGKVVLVDFGIAKVYEPNMHTIAGARAVTPGFSPPEQYGKGITDVQSDIYALGATIYTLLTGQEPPESVEILAKNAPPLPLVSSVNSSVSEQVSSAIERAMQPEKALRFGNVVEFKAALHNKAVKSLPGVDQIERILAMIAIFFVAVIVFGLLYGMVKNKVFPTTTQAIVLDYPTNSEISSTGTVEPATATIDAETIVLETEIPVATEVPTIESTATPATLPVQIVDDFGVPMALISEGEFQMGSTDGGSDERPVHGVYLDAYYFDIYEVTNQLYENCVQDDACSPPVTSKSYTHSSYYGNSIYADYPVINVDWNQARKFCEWRGGSLPSEAQWEKAARGEMEGKEYPWGDKAPICQKGAENGAKFVDNVGCNYTDTEPVGSYAPNGYGLYDMAGNVWEWMWDWYSENYYSSLSAWNNPTGPDMGQFRVLRGGSLHNKDVTTLRVASRHWYAPAAFDITLGFRCARSATIPIVKLGTPTSLAIQVNPVQTERPTSVNPILFFDDFENQSITLMQWYIDDGTWEIVNGNYQCSANGSSFAGNEEWTNYTLNVDLMGIDVVDKIIHFRYSNEARYGIDFRSNPYNDLVLVKVLSGKDSQILKDVPITNYNGLWYSLKIVLADNSIEIYVNENKILSYVDDSLPILNGRIGLGAMLSGLPSSAVYYNNIKVTEER